MERWRKKGMQAYNAPQKGKELVMPLPEEGSKQRDEVKRAFTPPPFLDEPSCDLEIMKWQENEQEIYLCFSSDSIRKVACVIPPPPSRRPFTFFLVFVVFCRKSWKKGAMA